MPAPAGRAVHLAGEASSLVSYPVPSNNVFVKALLAILISAGPALHAAEQVVVRDGRIEAAVCNESRWQAGPGSIASTGKHYLYAQTGIGAGDFAIRARLSLDALNRSAAALVIDGNQFGFEGAHGKMFVNGPDFGAGRPIGEPSDFFTAGEPFDLLVTRTGGKLRCFIDDREVWSGSIRTGEISTVGLRPWRATMRIYDFTITGSPPAKIRIPIIDISGQTDRHIMVAAGTRTDYRGQVNTVLLRDGKTMLATWSIGHGGQAGPLKKSVDGGITWGGLIDTPSNWRGIRSCPCIFRLTDTRGVERLFVFAGKPAHHSAVSIDGGDTWSQMKPTGLFKPGGNTDIIPIHNGRQHLLHMQRGPADSELGESGMSIWQAISSDGGLTWNDYRKVCEVPGAEPCEPNLIRSPDGRQLASLLRENSRRLRSLVIFSDDEGKSWTSARELPAELTGDRHMSSYGPDGRLVVVFRDRAGTSPTYGHYVAWIGTYEDIVHNRPGQYRVKLLHSHAGPDCGYSGLERLPDGTMVATTYIKYRPGPQKHSIVSVRFKLAEIDQAARRN